VNCLYTSAAYLNNSTRPFADQTAALLVCSCGTYRLTGEDQLSTQRPAGRPDYQLLYVAAGKALFVLDGREQELTAGHMVLFRPDQAQHYHYHGRDRTRVYWVHFTGGQVEQILEGSRISREERVFFAGLDPVFCRLFEDMIHELQSGRPDYQTMLELYLRQLFVMSRRAQPRPVCGVSPIVYEQVEQARRWFAQHYNASISIREYAARQNMSVSWFLRSFRQVTGQSPMQYIISVRMTNAVSLMQDTDWNLTRIAAAVGYDNPLYFSRLFKKYRGTSPSAYRRMLLARTAGA